MHLKKIGINSSRVAIVPISSYDGDNLLFVSEKMPWFTNWTITGLGRIKFRIFLII